MTGALTSTLNLALFTLMALRPPMPRRSSPFNIQFALGWWINEMPFLGLCWLFAATIGTLADPRPGFTWWLVAGLSALDAVLLGWIAARARSVRPVLTEAFRAAYGPDGVPRYTRAAWWRFVLPIISWRPDVRRIRNRRYGPSRRGNRLDVYVSQRRNRHSPRSVIDAPVLVYVHGGGFVMGNKMFGARPLLYRLAARGWVCVSIDYRLLRVRYEDQLADVCAALAWIRASVQSFGGNPDTLFVAGGSAGAHLAATAALSDAADPEVRSAIRGVIGLYGYYGQVGGAGVAPASPHDSVRADAPPFLILHGTLDTLVLHREARAFADRLAAVSEQPVVYAELPATHHNFDFFQSPRFHIIADAIVRFTELARRPDR
ncbi:MAG: alpha/beta hydrolase [Catenulispora sp.]|nr:alpha/beta hydrolase [Catenulispora sp.]